MTSSRLALSPKQIDSIMEARAFQNVWEGSVRSGKTIASLLCWLDFVAHRPAGGELVMVGRTRDSLARNVFGPLTDPTIFGSLARDITYTNGAPTASVLGRTVHALGANDAQAEPKVRGLTCAGAYADELTTLPKSFYDQLNARCSVEGSKIFATTNPDNPNHWARKEYLLRPREQRLRTWHFVMDDNPGLSESYKARQRAAHRGLFYTRNIQGLWVMAEGAIYEAYDEAVHVVDTLPEMRRYWLGMDYGTVNPTSVILLGEGVDGRLYACAEWRHDSRTAMRQMTDAQYSAAIRAWLADYRPPGAPDTARGVIPEWSFVDPSAASFITQAYADDFPNLAKADNTVSDGIRNVASLLAAGLLRIHRSCAGLIDELPGYVWDEKAAEKGEDKPVKINDHSCDALRYAVHSTAHEWRHLLTLAA
ncbi:PBSX family phage terminase large subunit [Streptomyces sp. SID4919]|uniref:PBSX family phage terminase large subunit n=1 Tax=unclassified Streptomyces TaxID=2593676 RepID=UPI000823AE92|nr:MULTISPECIES: PBSX family phage terminase large subunit [unclassified Streptomyces]MYY08818.1 PBSX family phage terminase large subunit [Streptomyces sp. SID4919]SCK25520.1 phage terminase, large subunit, PBSX family [Streptomyces sp. AmelKG-E11A]